METTPGKTQLDSPATTGKVSGVAPLVSVVIPTYNGTRYLAETLESALAQTYPRIEIIVIDDGSFDDTAKVAQSHPVTYIYQANRGISAARNAGIKHSQGEYILFLDHDDRLLPEAVATGVKILEEHPECAVAVGEHRYIGADGKTMGRSNKRPMGRDPYLLLLEHNFVETPCSALHRRSGLSTAGVFDETVQGAEDYELYLRTARQSSLIAHDATVSEYRLHNASTSRNAEAMLLVSHRVMEMELPHLEGDPAKLRLHHRGVKFIQRHFGRRLAQELIRNPSLVQAEYRRKLDLLKHHYAPGFAAVVMSRLLPPWLRKKVLDLRAWQVAARAS